MNIPLWRRRNAAWKFTIEMHLITVFEEDELNRWWVSVMTVLEFSISYCLSIWGAKKPMEEGYALSWKSLNSFLMSWSGMGWMGMLAWRRIFPNKASKYLPQIILDYFKYIFQASLRLLMIFHNPRLRISGECFLKTSLALFWKHYSHVS
jgi:hypothetical protein